MFKNKKQGKKGTKFMKSGFRHPWRLTTKVIGILLELTNKNYLFSQSLNKFEGYKTKSKKFQCSSTKIQFTLIIK